MRVMQLIDSLNTGGAERVAVNLSNILSDKIDRSFLCATREEGLLKSQIHENVGYLFLNKKSTFDLRSFIKLRNYIKQHNIDIIHAHSSSFFLASIVKLLSRNVKVVWHDHYGNSEFLENRDTKYLQFFSKYFSYVFSVNRQLESWAKTKLKAKNVEYLPNIAVLNESEKITKLKGVSGKRIVCLANLRKQKDHHTLFKAFNELIKNYPEWTLHCVGKDFDDDYSDQIKEKISVLNLQDHVFIYGSREDIAYILEQSDIGVLSSISEGLPIALLEYGLAGLATVVTDVGYCKEVVVNNETGLLIESQDESQLLNALIKYIEDNTLRKQLALNLMSHVKKSYTKDAIMQNLLSKYTKII